MHLIKLFCHICLLLSVILKVDLNFNSALQHVQPLSEKESFSTFWYTGQGLFNSVFMNKKWALLWYQIRHSAIVGQTHCVLVLNDGLHTSFHQKAIISRKKSINTNKSTSVTWSCVSSYFRINTIKHRERLARSVVQKREFNLKITGLSKSN